MRSISFAPFALAGSVTFALGVATGCGDSTGLGPAVFTNFVDTVTLAALRDTPVPAASGFDMVFGRLARTDQGQPFDFAFDIDDEGTAVLFPAGLMGFQKEPGWRRSNQEFAEIARAPTEDYTVDSPLTVALDDVFIARSRNSSSGCGYLGSLPRYGKFRVLELNFEERSLTLEVLVDLNCGFRGLEPGVPTS
ncbi:MAG: hypothetical protein JSW71_23660 [Gemmatimonadota bacterium]|nr:MAG: hypothetical protein JSW71_23660 [Gemmatimonadota bacterium]